MTDSKLEMICKEKSFWWALQGLLPRLQSLLEHRLAYQVVGFVSLSFLISELEILECFQEWANAVSTPILFLLSLYFLTSLSLIPFSSSCLLSLAFTAFTTLFFVTCFVFISSCCWQRIERRCLVYKSKKHCFGLCSCYMNSLILSLYLAFTLFLTESS